MIPNLEFVRSVVIAAEEQKSLDGVLPFDDFRLTHLSCGVVEETLPTINSDKVDPVTSDLLPIFRSRLHCNKHNVSSLPQELEGEQPV